MHALIDLGSTHSYVCIGHVFDKVTVVEQLSYDMHVTSPLGHNVNVNRVYRNCPIVIQDREFSADLIALPFREFDFILGMDWLSKHKTILDCEKKTVVLRCFDQSELIVQGIRSSTVRPEKFQFLEKGQNHNFDYKIVISVKNSEFIL